MNIFNKKSAKKGELYIYAEIDPHWGIGAQAIASALKEIGQVDELDVFINSPGGSVFEGIAIFNQLKRLKAKKTFYIDALAASIASVIVMAGDEIVIAENAQEMIHDPWGVSFGTAEDMRKYADLLDQSKETIVSTYASRTKQTRANILAWMAEETWMTAQEAVKRGFADRVASFTSPEAKAPADSQILARYKHTPPQLLKMALDRKVMVASMERKASLLKASLQQKSGSPA